MAVTERVISVAPDRVFAVLADGWNYSNWVVGAAHIRAVDAGWPAPGTRIHHSSGMWPANIDDVTVSVAVREPQEMVLRARLWPLGEATVHIALTAVNGGTKVTITEDFAAGPLRAVRTKINDLALHYRNREALRRLADLALRKPPCVRQP